MICLMHKTAYAHRFRIAIFILYLGALCSISCRAADLRLGIIGTDSTHAVEFTRILNDPSAPDHVPGARVVAAYRGGNPNMPLSRDRIAAITTTLQATWHLPFVERIADLCPRIDGVLLLSVDPHLHLKEFTEASVCHKPIFIDKPLAATLQQVQQIAMLASRQNTRWFSASSLRFSKAQKLPTQGITGAAVWGPGALGAKDYPLDLAWYGIHSIELLYSLMGPGVATVSRTHTEATDAITAVWNNGRIGTIRLVRPSMNFGAEVFLPDGRSQVEDNLQADYAPLVAAIVRFMETGVSPVPPQQTLETFAFMEAARISTLHRGSSTRIPRH